MPVRPLDQAQLSIGPYVDDIVQIVHESHSHFVSVCGSILHSLEAGTKASVMRDLIIVRLRAWCDDTLGVHFFRQGNLCWIGFKNNWIARVKLLDDRFGVGVSPTGASDQYNRMICPRAFKTISLKMEKLLFFT
jgi:hypothetical protein